MVWTWLEQMVSEQTFSLGRDFVSYTLRTTMGF